MALSLYAGVPGLDLGCSQDSRLESWGSLGVRLRTWSGAELDSVGVGVPRSCGAAGPVC